MQRLLAGPKDTTAAGKYWEGEEPNSPKGSGGAPSWDQRRCRRSSNRGGTATSQWRSRLTSPEVVRDWQYSRNYIWSDGSRLEDGKVRAAAVRWRQERVEPPWIGPALDRRYTHRWGKGGRLDGQGLPRRTEQRDLRRRAVRSVPSDEDRRRAKRRVPGLYRPLGFRGCDRACPIR